MGASRDPTWMQDCMIRENPLKLDGQSKEPCKFTGNKNALSSAKIKGITLLHHLLMCICICPGQLHAGKNVCATLHHQPTIRQNFPWIWCLTGKLQLLFISSSTLPTDFIILATHAHLYPMQTPLELTLF